ncbi:hypothetical protein VTO42DRAFT_5255 [Malbranchea cinnamomea]
MSSVNERLSNEMPLGLPGSLSSLVAQRFAAAKQAGALVFSHTEVTTISTSKIPFQLRYCPALAKKPSQAPPEPGPEKNKPKIDPFANPSSDLLVAEIPQSNPTHYLVLNKFPVIPNHFILATKLYKPQGDLLEKDDLAATYACLREWESSNSERPSGRLFAFFNSGEHSGASQPHRHLQFLPVEDMTQPDDTRNWTPLIDGSHHGVSDAQPNGNARPLLDLPFACYAVDLPRDPGADDLHHLYLSLYKLAVIVANGQNPDSNSSNLNKNTPQTGGPSAISYNLAMTTSKMMICPRRSEHALIRLDEKSREGLLEEGVVKLNGTILAGTLMVKAESEWKALQDQPTMLESVLQTVGFPWPAGSNSRM